MTKPEKTDDEKNPNLIEFSTGVKVLAKSVPSLLFVKVLSKDPPPDMPGFMSGNHFITNPDDPNYIEQMRHYELKRTDTMIDVMIAYGTELIEVPKGVEKHTSDKWIEKLEIAGIDTKPDSESWRYLFWIKSVAAVTADDLAELQEKVGRLSGVPEADVKSAASFPGS